jgi:hypothetical protein
MRTAIGDATGMRVLPDLHGDRPLHALSVLLALGAGAWLGTIGLGAMFPPPPPGF